MLIKFKKHQYEPNITNSKTYKGFRVQKGDRALDKDYLDRILDTLNKALCDHPRTFAFRVDLQLPPRMMLNESDPDRYYDPLQHFNTDLEHRLVDRFVSSLKAQ